MGWRLTVDRDRCIGSGSCVVYAPGTFEQDEQATCVLREPVTDELEQIRIAVESCPTTAIALNDDEGMT